MQYIENCDIKELFPQIGIHNLQYDCFLWDYEKVCINHEVMVYFQKKYKAVQIVLFQNERLYLPITERKRKERSFEKYFHKGVNINIIIEEEEFIKNYYLRKGAYAFEFEHIETLMNIVNNDWINSFFIITEKDASCLNERIKYLFESKKIDIQNVVENICDEECSAVYIINGCDGGTVNIIHII